MTKWLTLVLAPLGAMSTKNWILVWVFLEFSSMSFILLSKNKSPSESLLKYFLIQTLSSIFIILSVSMDFKHNFLKDFPFNSILSSTIIVSLIMKAGLAPLHFWIIQVSKNLEKTPLLLFLSIQKLAPLGIISLTSNMLITSMIILLNSFVGTISQMYSLNMNLILTFSSISHSSWIILSGMNNVNMFILYYVVYTIILTQIILTMKSNSDMLTNSKNMKNMIILFLSLAGLPPLLGFIPKWLTILFCLNTPSLKITCFFLMIMACLNVFIYLRIFSIIILKTPIMKNTEENIFSSLTQNFVNLSPIILFLSPKI